jgi:hypothetical protein
LPKKVPEASGPTVGDWLKSITDGKEERLRFLFSEMGNLIRAPKTVPSIC